MGKCDFPDVGYTPNNLRFILNKASLTQRECAALLGVAPRTVQYWCAPIGVQYHTDMPTEKWEELKSHVGA